MNIFSIAILAITFFSCSGGKDRSKLIASVDQERITAKMIQDRLKISKVYYPNSDLNAARFQLIRAFTFKKILENNGMKVTPTELLKESERIERDSKDRPTLEKIQAIFEKDSPQYMELFILPTLVERSLYPFFLNSEKFHESARKPALEFLKSATKVKSESSFRMLAKAKSQNIYTAKIGADSIQWNYSDNKNSENKSDGKTDATTPSAKAKSDQMLQEHDLAQVQFWKETILPKLKISSTFPELIPMGDHWFVIQKVSADRFHYVAFPKADFDGWLETEKRRVTVLEHDQKEY